MKKSKFLAQLTDVARNTTRELGVYNEQLVQALVTNMFNAITASGMLPPRTEYDVNGVKFSDHFWESEDTLPTTRAESP